MRCVQSAFAIIFVLVALFGASSCALYEELEPLGPNPNETDAHSDLEADGASDIEDAWGPDADTDTVSDTTSDAESDADLDTTSDADAEIESDAELDTTSDADAETESDAELDTTSDADAETESDAELDTTSDADADVESDADSEITIGVEPARAMLFAGEQAQFDATLLDAMSQEVSGVSVTWSVADTSVATVDTNGLVTAVAIGSTEVTASAAGTSASSSIEVLRWAQISVGNQFSCGVLSNGDAYCWGRNNTGGILGNGTIDSSLDNSNLNGDADTSLPTALHGGIEFASLTAGINHSCGLTRTGKAYCWGLGGAGHLGQVTFEHSAVPVAVSGAYQFSEIKVGANHTCAISLSNDLYCWGYNGDGQIGQQSGTSSSTPRQVLGHKFVSVAVGVSHSCAVSQAGATYCWGLGNQGQLGDGSGSSGAQLVQVDTGEEFVALSAGYDFTCGINALGEVFCWGDNGYAALGDGTTVNRFRPVRADPGHTYVKIFTGTSSTCALDSNQDLFCWGFNGQGNFGIGGPSPSEASRVLVSGGYQWRDFSHGLQHACGLADGMAEALCWGDNDNGQAGNGSISNYVSIPTVVSQPSF